MVLVKVGQFVTEDRSRREAAGQNTILRMDINKTEVDKKTQKIDVLHCRQPECELTLSYYSTPNKFIILTNPLMI